MSYLTDTEKSWDFTDETHPEFPECRRIVANKNHLDMKEGTLGGFVERKNNLSGRSAWVSKDSVVKGYAIVKDEATITGSSVISDYAMVAGNATVHNSTVEDDVTIYDRASLVRSTAKGYVTVGGSINFTDSRLSGYADISSSDGYFFHDAFIRKTTDLFSLSPIGSESSVAYLYRTYSDAVDPESPFVPHTLRVGCWQGGVNTLAEEVQRRSITNWDENAPRENWRRWFRQYARLEEIGWDLLEQWKEEDREREEKSKIEHIIKDGVLRSGVGIVTGSASE